MGPWLQKQPTIWHARMTIANPAFVDDVNRAINVRTFVLKGGGVPQKLLTNTQIKKNLKKNLKKNHPVGGVL